MLPNYDNLTLTPLQLNELGVERWNSIVAKPEHKITLETPMHSIPFDVSINMENGDSEGCFLAYNIESGIAIVMDKTHRPRNVWDALQERDRLQGHDELQDRGEKIRNSY